MRIRSRIGLVFPQITQRYPARRVTLGVRIIALASAITACALATPSTANEAAICRAGNSKNLRGLDQVYQRGEFRIVYATRGPHALAATMDRNHNAVPDRVEDVATQLLTANRIYSEIIGLNPPLAMPRYAHVQSIDVFLLNMEQGHGVAYDEPVNYRLAFDGPNGQCALRIDLSNSLANQNVTPAHELFHLYQYAYSMFKARWFLEGSARWAEYALQAGEAPEMRLPTTGPVLQKQLFAQTYRTSGLWNRLAKIADPAGRIALPNDLADATYLDGGAVVHDDRLHGAAFMKALLDEMNMLSAHVAARQRWDRYSWDEADQKSPVHDQALFRALRLALERSMTADASRVPELRAFFRAGAEQAPPDHQTVSDR